MVRVLPPSGAGDARSGAGDSSSGAGAAAVVRVMWVTAAVLRVLCRSGAGDPRSGAGQLPQCGAGDVGDCRSGAGDSRSDAGAATVARGTEP